MQNVIVLRKYGLFYYYWTEIQLFFHKQMHNNSKNCSSMGVWFWEGLHLRYFSSTWVDGLWHPWGLLVICLKSSLILHFTAARFPVKHVERTPSFSAVVLDFLSAFLQGLHENIYILVGLDPNQLPGQVDLKLHVSKLVEDSCNGSGASFAGHCHLKLVLSHVVSDVWWFAIGPTLDFCLY